MRNYPDNRNNFWLNLVSGNAFIDCLEKWNYKCGQAYRSPPFPHKCKSANLPCAPLLKGEEMLWRAYVSAYTRDRE